MGGTISIPSRTTSPSSVRIYLDELFKTSIKIKKWLNYFIILKTIVTNSGFNMTRIITIMLFETARKMCSTGKANTIGHFFNRMS